MSKFLDLNGVKYLWEKCKDFFISKQDANNEFYHKSEIDGMLSEIDVSSQLSDYVKKGELPEEYNDTEIKERLSNLEAIDHNKFLTEHQPLSDYYTKTQTESKIDEKISNIDYSSYETVQGAKEKYETKEDALTLDQKFTEITNNQGELISDASARISELEKIDHSQYLTEHQSLDNYYNKSQVDSKITDAVTGGKVDLSGYETVEDAAAKYQPKGNYITEHQSLENYYTKSESEDKFQPIGDYLVEEDIANFATQSDVSEEIKKIVGSAPEALDTLEEIANKLEEDSDAIKAINGVLEGKVNKDGNKGLSTNDYTTAEKNKLKGIEEGAQVNTVNSVANKTGNIVLNKTDVGLSNIDNTSDLDKPISTAVKSELDKLKYTTANGTLCDVQIVGELNDSELYLQTVSKSYNDQTKEKTAIPTATVDSNGLMSNTDKNNLNQLFKAVNKFSASGINNSNGVVITITHAQIEEDSDTGQWRVFDDSLEVGIPVAGSKRSGLMSPEDVINLNLIPDLFDLCDIGCDYSAELVTIKHNIPKPISGSLQQGPTWDYDYVTKEATIPTASEYNAGVMSAQDKKNLDFIPEVFDKFFVDTVSTEDSFSIKMNIPAIAVKADGKNNWVSIVRDMIIDIPVVTTGAPGIMAAADKQKLDSLPLIQVVSKDEYNTMEKDNGTLYFITD